MVLWLHTSSQTKPNLLQIWTKRREVQQANRGVGGRLRRPYSYFTVHSTSSISWGIRAKSPFGGCIFICVHKDVKKKERTLACVKAIRFIIFLSISLFLLHFLFSLCGRGNPKSPYSFPLNVGPIKHICGFSY